MKSVFRELTYEACLGQSAVRQHGYATWQVVKGYIAQGRTDSGTRV